MMKLPVHIARKLLLLTEGQEIPASSMKHATTVQLLDDGILRQRVSGKNKSAYFTPDVKALTNYIQHNFGINHLADYISLHENPAESRAQNILAGSNSKLQRVSTFRGFMVNSLSPISALLHEQPIVIQPAPGTCLFVNNYEQFVPSPSTIIVGVENAENFFQVHRQSYLFQGLETLFVSRYPQSGSLISWLMSIPNRYLHFGDLDFEGINIYINEFRKHLKDRAQFFIPPTTLELIELYGNRALFTKQYSNRLVDTASDPSLQPLIDLLVQKGKVLEQEIFIR